MENLPPPPPIVPSHAIVVAPPPPRLPMVRQGLGKKGQVIQLLTNHFKVKVSKTDGHFYQYTVSITYGSDGKPVEAKGIGRKILENLHKTYRAELDGKDFAYDGENSLFTIGALPNSKIEFTVLLDESPSNRNGIPEADDNNDRKRSRKQSRLKTYLVEIKYATKIPIVALNNAINGKGSQHFQEAVKVLDIILRQNAAKQGCLLVRQSFFQNEPKNFVQLGGGVLACRGMHSSFRATQGALSLNMDVSTTIIIKPGPVIDFLLENQNVKHSSRIDWVKAKRTLKNMMIKALNTNREAKIRGLSDRICGEQMFSLKSGGNGNVEMLVYDYFVKERKIPLKYSGDLPCIDVGKPKRPVYIPIELCELVSLQRYTKAMTNLQRSALVEKSRQKPQERMRALKQGLENSNYNADALLKSCGVTISRDFTQVEGRILQAPVLKVGEGGEIYPRNGKWNFNNRKLIEPFSIDRWVIVNFSARVEIKKLIEDLMRCGRMKGMMIEEPARLFEENNHVRRNTPVARVEDMITVMKKGIPGPPQIVLCILPERKNSELYGPWKRKTLSELGIISQCMSPPARLTDQYLTNLLLKMNVKLGGLNSQLVLEHSRSIPMISKIPTLILGIDVSHGSAGRDVPSVAAVVSSRQWPLISRYRASVRTQPAKMEMIDNIFKVVDDKDEGIFNELLMDFYMSSGQRKPEHIIIFRDGVSESQFSQVLNIELEQIIQACKFRDSTWNPKFTVIVAQKNHHTKFFQTNSPDNVPPGTIVDNGVCHPTNNDFYLCAQAGMIGTTRPTHYQVLYDEIGFSVDDLQGLVHSLSYVYQRSTTSVSVVAPVCYAHLAAAQMAQFIKFEDFSDRGSSNADGSSVVELPKLHDRVSHTMFFC